MHRAVQTELLKARSGFWMLAVLAYALLLPFFAWAFAGRGNAPPGSDDATATHLMLTFLAVCPVAATFLGCFLVTRDYYYKSIERSVLLQRKAHVFGGKIITGAAAGLAVGLVGTVGWSGITVFVLRSRNQVFDTGVGTWQTLGGSVAACALACVLGVAIGWILPNYYAATTVALMLPFAVELPLLLFAPEIAHFLPNTALAGVAQTSLPGLFGFWLSALIVLLWLAVAVVAGWHLFKRREIR